ncbi:MAG TPA: energy transducer TonB [Candidatus Angelobacter sp.]|nr:energy transducer TonB [Candidatus Angelobacter sp.]
MAALRFNYELSPARKDRHVISLVIHVVAIVALWLILPLLPTPQIIRQSTQVSQLIAPPPELKPPAPVVKILPPPPKVLAMLKPPKLILNRPDPKIEPPKIEVQPKMTEFKAPVPVAPKLEPKKEIVTGAFVTPEAQKPVENKKEIVASSFATGSSEPATLHKPARDVQTGGFGDPNGIRGTSERKGPVTVAALGGFNLPSGPGNGNGTGGARGASGTIASAGFGDVAAVGVGDHARRGSVEQTGFGQAAAPAQAPKAHAATDEKVTTKPVEVLFKPRPIYTDEAKQLHIEGEVLVQVVFAATGQMQVQKVVKGLGHGLDEAALRAAQQIKFHPAQRDGSPYDYAALVHIVFALAE